MHGSEGLRYPSIDQLIDKTNSKYKLVIAVAKRAREIEEGVHAPDKGVPLIDKPVNKKSIGMALEEILAGKVKVK
ncbi:MAG: DNA-directed RNA polymerase subunit omega [Bacilli bacterium]|jgi:DNA-directed RNA polymerase subunit omega